MSIEAAYNKWAAVYDTNLNKTRDLEAVAIRTLLQPYTFKNFLEVGCGTGKNTEWLVTKAEKITAVDLSAEMLATARQKIKNDNVKFIQADINMDWIFINNMFDGIGFSLVLEHIENLQHVFKQAANKLSANGLMYIGELHPFKQYSGSKARFDTGEGVEIVSCFTHHVSEFVAAAKQAGFMLKDVNEFFDEVNEADVNQQIPRLITFLFEKV